MEQTKAFGSLLDRARELKAINQIIGEMHQEGVADNNPQMQQARDQLLPRFLTQFHSATRETFTTPYYPTKERLAKADFLMEFKENRYDGEEQVTETLKANYKYTDEVSGETFRKKVEVRLFTQKTMLWSEIMRRSATNTAWQWHYADALDRLKDDCIHQDTWREDGNYVDKGPFPKPTTAVKIQELARDDDTGAVELRLTPVNGDTLYAEFGGPATHHLFTPRQLLVHGLLADLGARRSRTPEEQVACFLGLARCADWDSKLCRWDSSPTNEKVAQTFSNQALNTLDTFAGKGISSLHSSWFLRVRPVRVSNADVVEPADARTLDSFCDAWVTDPPYADAIDYHELSEYLLSWYEWQIPPRFPEWYTDSKRALAICGSGKEYR